MQYVNEMINEAVTSMRQIEKSLQKRFKPGISERVIQITNRQLAGVKLALEALERINPTAPNENCECVFCGRSLKNIYTVAEDVLYCCPYCGQALDWRAAEDENNPLVSYADSSL